MIMLENDLLKDTMTQPAFTYSKLKETLEQGVKYVQS